MGGCYSPSPPSTAAERQMLSPLLPGLHRPGGSELLMGRDAVDASWCRGLVKNGSLQGPQHRVARPLSWTLPSGSLAVALLSSQVCCKTRKSSKLAGVTRKQKGMSLCQGGSAPALPRSKALGLSFATLSALPRASSLRRKEAAKALHPQAPPEERLQLLSS